MRNNAASAHFDLLDMGHIYGLITEYSVLLVTTSFYGLIGCVFFHFRPFRESWNIIFVTMHSKTKFTNVYF